MDVDINWPGSVHDAKVFANSSFSNKLRSGNFPQIWKSLLPGEEKIPTYIIGDPAYPLTPFCLKEYDPCVSNEQVVFNTMLRSAHNPIECAFGRLKARWGTLTRTIDLKLESVPTVVYACFVLHNYCESQRCQVDEELVMQQVERIAAKKRCIAMSQIRFTRTCQQKAKLLGGLSLAMYETTSEESNTKCWD